MSRKTESRKPKSMLRAVVGRSNDVAEWLENVRLFADRTNHIIDKWEPLSVWMSPEYLKQAREETGLSQRDLAEATEISRSVIANYEIGLKDFVWENAVKLYGVLEAHGSNSAAKARLMMTEIDKEISLAHIQVIEGKREALKAHVEKCESENQRLRAKLGLSKDSTLKFK